MSLSPVTATLLENRLHIEETAHGAAVLRGSLVVFSDDWGRHPSSCQHLMARLSDRYRILWVNTIGTRGPRLDIATFRRAIGKVRMRLPLASLHDEPSDRVRVLNPLMWPWFRRPIDRRLNKRLLSRALAGPIAELPRPVVAVTTIPLVADLVGTLEVDRWLYYCVDDLASWPGLDSEPLRTMERELVAKVDGAVAVSEYLVDRLDRMGRRAVVVSHGVDLRRWTDSSSAAKSAPADLGRLEHPWVVFWGLVDERMDAEWVRALADAMTSGTVILAGPIAAVDLRLLQHPRIALPGPLSYDDLPAVAKLTSVLIMPYRRMPATEAMQPLKLKEYMATGRPCVVRNLPSTAPWSDCIDVVDAADEFAKAVLSRIDQPLPATQHSARERLAAESWEAKAQAFETAIRQTLMMTVGA